MHIYIYIYIFFFFRAGFHLNPRAPSGAASVVKVTVFVAKWGQVWWKKYVGQSRLKYMFKKYFPCSVVLKFALFNYSTNCTILDLTSEPHSIAINSHNGSLCHWHILYWSRFYVGFHLPRYFVLQPQHFERESTFHQVK